MIFLSNIYNPELPDAKMYYICSSHAIIYGEEGIEREWQRHLDWVNRNIIGLPQATDKYTVEELVKMNIVGIYEK